VFFIFTKIIHSSVPNMFPRDWLILLSFSSRTEIILISDTPFFFFFI